jgi:hypothetical protein
MTFSRVEVKHYQNFSLYLASLCDSTSSFFQVMIGEPVGQGSGEGGGTARPDSGLSDSGNNPAPAGSNSTNVSIAATNPGSNVNSNTSTLKLGNATFLPSVTMPPISNLNFSATKSDFNSTVDKTL